MRKSEPTVDTAEAMETTGRFLFIFFILSHVVSTGQALRGRKTSIRELSDTGAVTDHHAGRIVIAFLNACTQALCGRPSSNAAILYSTIYGRQNYTASVRPPRPPLPRAVLYSLRRLRPLNVSARYVFSAFDYVRPRVCRLLLQNGLLLPARGEDVSTVARWRGELGRSRARTVYPAAPTTVR